MDNCGQTDNLRIPYIFNWKESKTLNIRETINLRFELTKDSSQLRRVIFQLAGAQKIVG